MNTQPVNMTGDGGDVMGKDIAKHLPNATDFWDITWTDTETYNEFYDAVYNARNDGEPYPYRYGSYQIYYANTNTHLYQVTNFLNVTSQDVTGMFP